MKKFAVLVCFVLIFLSFTLISCGKKDGLSPFVSDLKENIFVGENQDFSLTAYYGKREEPFIKDGKVGLLKPRLVVKITSDFNSSTSSLGAITVKDVSYKENFVFDPTSNKLTATFNIENFDLNSFDITIYYLDTSSTITLNSIKPKDTISTVEALSFLQKNQPTLIESYFTENTFNAEIFIRLIVQKDKPYYYVGIANSKKIVAFLLDGYTGEVLSIKEVF
ncbi:MAG: hypothetical protein IKC71_04670 [Clostridia bacterium]|nr:hypothetical protein [Clostridia bacterium]